MLQLEVARTVLCVPLHCRRQPPDSPSIFSDGSSDDDGDGDEDTLQDVALDGNGMKIQILPAAYKLANDLAHESLCRLHRGYYIRHYRCRCYHRATDLSRPLARNTSRPRLRQRRSTLVAAWRTPVAPDAFVCAAGSDDMYELLVRHLAGCTSTLPPPTPPPTHHPHYDRERSVSVVAVAPDAFIRAAVSDDIYERFEELLVRHYVGCTSTLKFCTYPSCTNTVSCPSAASKSSLTIVVPVVFCGARGLPTDQPLSQSQKLSKGIFAKEHKFCFGCTIDSDHAAICGVGLLWLKNLKCRDDSEAASWIQNNTKEYDREERPVQPAVQEVEYGTAYYSCNRYDEKAGVDARDAQSRSRASLERYLHFMKTALEVLDKCRIRLKWTYAMVYYLTKGNKQESFEDNQCDLERAVEQLPSLIE
ncbi:RBR-type E3 ubiquitin transferase [Mycena chlorophos]|uniref:RBR-type E3 ubiquitin transferase n=1 Tax=Mycena chlorophos TaxID=658473 RepID=A0A8H6WJU5_MYCCL|nr:RBR-type E3 ubiquitin transferase [Mycena chlorophos]